ncbi:MULTISPECIES: hypothetical protein [Methylobacterium]|jgi:hypothetical protein|uniref:Cysteine rich repeat protein n=1 Tax=Methylobacterium hispanicum TaxID=270350 RepID=A0AAV4ZTI9_9HYPH|nr:MULTISPECIES: hypothetical protein [Methylobacterium]GJD91315.1 hypothetical protein BHAOGJBA_4863 [Methylobacterium hispanicum]
MKALGALTLIALLAAGPTLAEPSAAQRAACTPDVMRLCASAIPNVGAIKTCLRAQRASLSAECRVAVDAGEGPRTRAAARS